MNLSIGVSKNLRPLVGRLSVKPLVSRHPPVAATCLRYYGAQQPRKGFFANLFDNLQQEFKKDKQMKENLQKFREEREKLEQSDALKKAREKFQNIEAESASQLKDITGSVKEKLAKSFEEVSKSEIGQKGKQVGDEVARQAKAAAEALASQGKNIAESEAVKTIGKGVKAVQEGVDIGVGVYRAPKVLRKRSERSLMSEDRPIEPNTEATGVELHKESRWSQSWEDFKANNQYVNKVFDWKMKYDESDNPVVRASRVLTDKLSDLFGSAFQRTELSEVLTEIIKMDPDFDKQLFIKELETDIIPNVLEAIIRGDLEILKDWCYEAAYNVLATPIKNAQALGLHFNNKVLDIENVEIAMGKIMDQGPVLVITFQAQQIMAVCDAKGTVVEGSLEKIQRYHYIWALCRDPTELDPKAAWRIVELAANASEQWL